MYVLWHSISKGSRSSVTWWMLGYPLQAKLFYLHNSPLRRDISTCWSFLDFEGSICQIMRDVLASWQVAHCKWGREHKLLCTIPKLRFKYIALQALEVNDQMLFKVSVLEWLLYRFKYYHTIRNIKQIQLLLLKNV